METICFIESTSYGSSIEAIKAAKRIGFYTVLFTEKKSLLEERNDFPMISKIVVLENMTVPLIENELTHLQQTGKVLKAILSFVDPFVSMAASLMNAHCDASISVRALQTMEDKAATRIALQHNRSTPNFKVHHPTEDISLPNHIEYPMIMKSSISKASEDVYVIANSNEMQKMMKKLRRLYPAQQIVIEKYLEGQQYLIEVIVHERDIHIVAIFKQHITKELKFIVTGYEIQHNDKKDFQEKLHETVTSIIEDLNVTTIACHLEMKYHNGEWKLVEINPRISGGAMNRMIEEALGINLVEETIQLYLGSTPMVKPKHNKYLYTHFITVGICGYLLKVTGVKCAARLQGVKEIYIKPRTGEVVMPAVSMGHRYGYVMATGNCANEARANAIQAANEIKFYVEEI